jgi:serine phosphatase RsbU (regulator of sigma subunit)
VAETQILDHKTTHRHSSSERRHLARALAKQLVPKLPELPNLDAAGLCVLGKDPGRDYYDCLQLHDGSWAALVATVNAQGLEAAPSSLQLRSAMHALALGYSDPGAILTILNRTFVADWPENRSATLTLVKFDPQTRQLSYASAGHPTGYVLDAYGQVKWNLESTDCPLGLLGNTMYGSSNPFSLDTGDTVALFSDGLLKTPIDGSPIGSARLLDTIGSQIRHPARTIVDAVAQSAHTGHPAADQTVLIVKVR